MLSTLQNFDNGEEGVAHPDDDRNTKKVRFKGNGGDEDTSMAVDHESQTSMTWKEKLLGGYDVASKSIRDGSSADNENEFELFEGDVNMSIIDGIPAINFSDRVKEILFKEMELTIIVKLLGRNIGYNALHNHILFLWNLYLTVQPWTKHFSLLQPYPSVVLAWIRLPNLPGYLYKWKIIEAIGGLIGKVVLVDEIAQHVEYEALPTVCFTCGKYGHVKEMCNSVVSSQNLTRLANKTDKPQAELMTVAVSTPVDSTGSKQMHLFKNVSVGDAINQNKLDAKMQENNEARVLEKIKSHYNPVFYESEGFIVPISENTLDPGKHSTVSFDKNINFMQQDNSKTKFVEFLELGPNSKSNGPKKRRNGGRENDSRNSKKTYFALRGRGNCFKSPGNTCVPLAESMVAMAELLSSQVLGVNSNVEVDGLCKR
ncbi:hypothetical protein GOBAR_AA08024 [Gossypium barbadense]|uniref:CCHC-type domain-containing protein n=1 Tax=Gossypium barbadense TaxID=3634 RepID=A0A2P5YAI4_GOSBA|nr:hypothetical protein GOBAR_AA08024 [Gossypium barbadense]